MRALQVAKYFITLNKMANLDEPSDLSKLKIQKLLYYAQGYYLALYDKPLFDDEIQAWEHGPVVVSVFDEFKKINDKFIPTDKYALSDDEIRNIGEEERELIEQVFDLMGQYSAWKLREMTHNETPWLNTYKNNEKNIVISQELIKSFFKNYVEL